MADRVVKMSVTRGTNGYVVVKCTVTEGDVSSSFSIRTYKSGIKAAAKEARENAVDFFLKVQ